MDGGEEKVYVALGNDLQDGFKTLEWALRKWTCHPISIVILHVTSDMSKGLVPGPYGKVPASSVSEEKLQVIKKYEQAKVDKLLSNYITFCGKVKSEILKVDKYDEPIRKLVLDLMAGLEITKFVMGLTFMKSSSGRSKGAISGAFYVHQNKPESCELFIICGGKLVFLEGIMEEDRGSMLARMREKGSFKGWLGKMLSTSSLERGLSQVSLDSPNSTTEWGHQNQELQKYFQQLLLMEESDVLETSPVEPQVMSEGEHNMCGREKSKYLRSKVDEARKAIQRNRDQYKANLERYAKAEWAIGLCNQRVVELETRTKEEVTRRKKSEKDLDTDREQFQQVTSDLQENKNKMCSLVELQSNLSTKLHLSRLAKSDVESRLERAVVARAEMVRAIEEVRRHRDVVQRRIEFCKDKEARGNVEATLSYRNYTAKEMRLATNDFSERMRIKCGGNWTNVYRGRVDQVMVAIKKLNPQQVLEDQVRLIGNIRHPHVVGMIGLCTELNCIVLEYMENGNLKTMRALKWFNCIRIAAEVASGLAFLHTAKPRPIVHGDLTLSNVLIGRNLVPRITGLCLTRSDEREHGVESDVRAFGVLMLEVLAGPDWVRIVQEAISTGQEIMGRVLEPAIGKWPSDLAEDFAKIALRCGSGGNGPHADTRMATIVEQLSALRNKANDRINNGECEVGIGDDNMDNSTDDVPHIFLCPIFKEVMEDPHVAADGFSYEQGAIKQWLKSGHDTSPMTNQRLDHTTLTPNYMLHSLIQDWHYQRSNVVKTYL